MRYTEGDRSLLIDSEVLAPPKTMAVLARSIRAWEPPHEADPVTADDRARILDNVRRAFDWQGAHLQVL